MSVPTYKSTLFYCLQEKNLHLHCGEGSYQFGCWCLMLVYTSGHSNQAHETKSSSDRHDALFIIYGCHICDLIQRYKNGDKYDTYHKSITVAVIIKVLTL